MACGAVAGTGAAFRKRGQKPDRTSALSPASSSRTCTCLVGAGRARSGAHRRPQGQARSRSAPRAPAPAVTARARSSRPTASPNAQDQGAGTTATDVDAAAACGRAEIDALLPGRRPSRWRADRRPGLARRGEGASCRSTAQGPRQAVQDGACSAQRRTSIFRPAPIAACRRPRPSASAPLWIVNAHAARDPGSTASRAPCSAPATAEALLGEGHRAAAHDPPERPRTLTILPAPLHPRRACASTATPAWVRGTGGAPAQLTRKNAPTSAAKGGRG